MQTEFSIDTNGPGLIEFTARIADWLPPRDGLLTVFVRHTSCSLLIQENADPDVQSDLLGWLVRLVPPADSASMRFITHRAEGVDDMPAHIKAAHLPVSLQIPVQDGRMRLGTWQGVFLFEHREAPHTRHVALHFAPDPVE
ncbi:secondary thiamine-phosphate synthase enzyme YjbQ [Palleronia sp. LCG004]|uniref:secondary thiamine-phosphate synthase enzyme YjbQ n=1 Tax=Palleronia sp. LCG004 TaxID=3079304 RepID=UPI0029429B69|nr:secondary thiamine-phosphate synthase enzyme YjbQ [Palleronia sp. LCG004]WOI57060.1 secondary thiamine-phosphate synthase enzyme YjbQ [Palleronia sp. LCG004]